MELLLDYSTDMSARNAARRLNRFRRESDGISAMTYRNTVEREGESIQLAIEKKCASSLVENGFTLNGEIEESTEFTAEISESMPIEAIGAAACELNIKKAYVSDYESAESAVNISIDDVGVKRQTETRPCGEAEQPKRVNNSVIHVESTDGKYILNSSSIFGVLRLLLGFLLCGGLLRKQLVFFTDGARDIHNEIPRMFAFANYKIILDWYHLAKKCREQLSMALFGSKIRNEFLEELLPCLWFGNVDGAIKLLRNINPKKVRNPDEIDKLVGYFERCRDYIPNYALRKELGLRNSSNSGEKANDLIVSSRQKNNGMSWSDKGSRTFASVSAAICNGELFNWIHYNALNFNLSIPDIA
jgi:hypothetical protein